MVLSISRDKESSSVLIESLGDFDSVEIGEVIENRLPIVVEAENPHEMEMLTERIRTLPGVVHLDVAYVSLD